MATTRRTPAATVASTLILRRSLLLLAGIGVSRGTRGRGWRGTHSQAGEGGLVASVGALSVHWHTQLLLSQLRELKSVDLRRHASHRGIALDGRRETANLAQLLWL